MEEIPNRLKYKDNPYTIYIRNNRYFVKFDNKVVEVSKDVFEVFDKSELKDRKELNEFSRHIDHFDRTEESIFKKTLFKSKETFDMVSEKIDEEILLDALSKLPYIQKIRIYKYYFEHKTLVQIAKEEDVKHSAVLKTIKIGLKNLRKILKNFK